MIEAKLFAYELLEELRRDLPFLDFASLALPADEAEACVVGRRRAYWPAPRRRWSSSSYSASS